MKYLKLDDLIDNSSNLIDFKAFKFSGGEQHIQILDPPGENVMIEVNLTSSDKIIQLILATDALKRCGCKKIDVFSPYIPYSRQDRVCNMGEPLSIKVLCSLLNIQNYNRIYSLDNHSDVTSALFNRNVQIDVCKIIKRCVPIDSSTVLISPDSGFLKKSFRIAMSLGIREVIECSKKRDVKTGAITGIKVPVDSLISFQNYLIVDDICDGGRTFIELAKVLRKKGATSISLFVSHGIFSQGLEVFDGLIDNIYTTKSFATVGRVHRERFLLNDVVEQSKERE